MSFFSSKWNPLFFIAEIGGNHEGDFEYAKKLTRLAVKSGADAIKYQIYKGDTLVSRAEEPKLNRHFGKFQLKREEYMELAEICRDAGVEFMASVWDMDSLAWVDELIRLYKVGSGDLTAYPLLKQIATTGKPIILSTGLSTIEEVAEVVDYLAAINDAYVSEGRLALLQCTTSYPCPAQDTNLNAMIELRDAFGLPVGYSDHTIGTEAALAAATMGAEILEMHFTDQREGKTFRDHLLSVTYDEVRTLLDQIRHVKVLQGVRIKRLTQSEREAGHLTSFRRSVYAARSISAGEHFTTENITILRPEHGIPAHQFHRLLGRTARRDIAEHEVLRDSDL